MTRLRTIAAAALLALAAALAAPASGQDAPQNDPPWEPQLLRLGEILGALAWLDPLCAGGITDWRAEMAALIDAESPEPGRRARLVDRFNLGYASFASVYRSCTPAARLAISRYRSEGADLAAAMRASWGPPADNIPLPEER
jgi:uncharacterized protein (TIGR02301 family)